MATHGQVFPKQTSQERSVGVSFNRYRAGSCALEGLLQPTKRAVVGAEECGRANPEMSILATYTPPFSLRSLFKPGCVCIWSCLHFCFLTYLDLCGLFARIFSSALQREEPLVCYIDNTSSTPVAPQPHSFSFTTHSLSCRLLLARPPPRPCTPLCALLRQLRRRLPRRRLIPPPLPDLPPSAPTHLSLSRASSAFTTPLVAVVPAAAATRRCHSTRTRKTWT